MNRNQIEFSEYWDKIATTSFYKVVKITDSSGFMDKILDNQRIELSKCIREEIDRTFFDTFMRPNATVWLENLKKDFPYEAREFERYIRGCEITSKGYENLLTIAAGSTAAITGAAIGNKKSNGSTGSYVKKKKSLASTLLMLGGITAAGYKIASGLNVDTQTLQEEVKIQFEVWKKALLNILDDCDDDIDAELNDDE